MSHLIVEQHFPEPVSEAQYDIWAKRVDPCLEARGALAAQLHLARSLPRDLRARGARHRRRALRPRLGCGGLPAGIASR